MSILRGHDQKVALAYAMVHEPTAAVLDEPFEFGGSGSRRTSAHPRGFVKSGGTVIVRATYGLVQRMCDTSP